jgi:putative transposase
VAIMRGGTENRASAGMRTSLLLNRIQEIYQKSRKVYGSPRITAELRDQGSRCGKNRIARIMKDNGIRAELKRRFRKATTDSKHHYSLAANLLVQNGYKGPLWASDITYVPTNEGWLYVSAIMSVQSRNHWAVYEEPAVGGPDRDST